MANLEQGSKTSPEQQLSPSELEKASREGKDRIQERLEERRGHEKDPSSRKAEARHEIERSTKEKEQTPAKRVERSPEKRQQVASKLDRKAAYKETMSSMRTQLPPASRAFSKVIHNPVVESVSEAAGKTVARPNAILAGSMSAFLFVLATYLIARYFGYPLSGFETIAAFIFGWVIGVIFDFFKAMITGGTR